MYVYIYIMYWDYQNKMECCVYCILYPTHYYFFFLWEGNIKESFGLQACPQLHKAAIRTLEKG